MDVAGIQVGHSARSGAGWLTGTTVVLAPPGGATGGVDVRGGGPGTRETDLLDPSNLVEHVNAIVLSGGSAFGLAAADGVMRALAERGEGQPVGGPGEVVPIVPAAVIFDLGRGGEFAATPTADFGRDAVAAASATERRLGNVGAGTGAQVGGLKGGVGSASVVLPDGTTVAALLVVNAVGSAVNPVTGELWAAPLLREADREIDPAVGPQPLERPDPAQVAASRDRAEQAPGLPRVLATTIGVIATDARLTKAQCRKVAGVGHDGMARAINPVHTMVDGDTIFTLATGAREAPGMEAFHLLLQAAGDCVSRAIARAVLAAESTSTPAGQWRSYRDVFPSSLR